MNTEFESLFEYTPKDRSYWLTWLLARRRDVRNAAKADTRIGEPLNVASEYDPIHSQDRVAGEVLRGLGFLPPEGMSQIDGAAETLNRLEESGMSPLMSWRDIQDMPPAGLVGDFVDKCMMGLVPIDVKKASYVTNQDLVDRRRERGRRGGVLAIYENEVPDEDDYPGLEYEDPALSEDGLAEQEMHLRQIEDASDDPGDLEEAVQNYNAWKNEVSHCDDDNDDGQYEFTVPSSGDIPVSPVQFPAWLSAALKQEVAAMTSTLKLESNLTQKDREELDEGLSSALLTEMLLLLAEHEGDWSGAALGYFKCLERVLVASLRKVAAEQCEKLDKASLSKCVRILIIGAAKYMNEPFEGVKGKLISLLIKLDSKAAKHVLPDLEKWTCTASTTGWMSVIGCAWWASMIGNMQHPSASSNTYSILMDLLVACGHRNQTAHVTPVESGTVKFVRQLLVGGFSPYVNHELSLFDVKSSFLAIVSGGEGVQPDQAAVGPLQSATREDRLRAWNTCYRKFIDVASNCLEEVSGILWIECIESWDERLDDYISHAESACAKILRGSGSGEGWWSSVWIEGDDMPFS